ncbi:SpoIIIAH-like family protein [Oceanobacillus neutriphilus]|uniref:Stage III sporulation protein AH n=1 Tax=Oceanobacillus neutriphilus TaxID=531815 RepID=A0ABQ2NX90_9BACI|nr:SpoIIIAH-like family protein [Oceanobacillus neutriphilus]GGP12798.1 stage III sporulation protein AH [Oceanobacillus neutriphilus]
MLKKQTVWLLTMLSLMVVLSVYYIFSSNGNDLAFVNDGQETATEDAVPATQSEEDIDVENIENVDSDELFTTIRMEIQDERSRKKSQLTDVVASANASPTEKDEALQEIDSLEELSSKESIIQQQLLAATEYEDILVRSDGEKVHVHVKAEELSNTEAANIMQMVRDEFGKDIVTEVNFQPTAK